MVFWSPRTIFMYLTITVDPKILAICLRVEGKFVGQRRGISNLRPLVTSNTSGKWLSIFILFIFYQSPCSYSVLIIGWRSPNFRTEAIETLDYVPIIYLVRYCISHVFGSCPLPPTYPIIPLHSPLPSPLPPPPLPLLLLGPVPPSPTISYQTMPQTYAPYPCRGPELSASWCNVRLRSHS